MSRAITDGIQVSVQSEFRPDRSFPAQSRFLFTYTVRILNGGASSARLLSRHWIITDARGEREEVRGDGVVGQQPLLKPGQSFEYTSGTRLRTPTGSMQGSYFCVAEDGEQFDAEIPAFVLDALGGPSGSGGSYTLH